MKLLIDTKTQRVLFAEAGKDVVDFLFSLLTLPIAAVRGRQRVQPLRQHREARRHLRPDRRVQGRAPPAPLWPSPPVQPKTFYRCCYNYTNCYLYVAGVRGTILYICPSCKKQMTSQVFYTGQTNLAESAASTAGSEARGGFVKGVVTYTVTDDLAVMPMSFAIRGSQRSPGEDRAHLGYDEGVEILKASMHSKQADRLPVTRVWLMIRKLEN
ncbi:hypothetical protein QOZ80_1AG0010080 [Eleusine coracana subsp. coracana]|nr:hypothetical protein QOZ80_1AG0010080 [Eleusine coracana subsp. coracana]